MFTYRCSHCRKQHVNLNPFVHEFQAKCLRCARPFVVTRSMIREATAGELALAPERGGGEAVVGATTGAASPNGHPPAPEPAGAPAGQGPMNAAATAEGPAAPLPTGFLYECRHCGGKHRNHDPFVQPFQTTCHVCRQPFMVTPEMVQPARGSGHSLQAAATYITINAGQVGVGGQENGAQGSGLGETIPVLPLEPRGEEGKAQNQKAEKGRHKYKKPKPRAIPLEGEDEDDDEDFDDDDDTPVARPAAKEPGKKRWPVIAAIVVPCLLAVGGGGYFAYSRWGKAKAPVAKGKTPIKTPTKTPPVVKTSGPPPKTVEGKKAAPPPKPAAVALSLSAPRLADEVASSPAATDGKYKDVWMEVSGLFDRMEAVKAATGTPPKRLYFQTERAAVACELSTAPGTDLSRLGSLRAGNPITVRGVYGKGGVLVNCDLPPPRAVADATYRGKTVEITGLVGEVVVPPPGAGFPRIDFANETNSSVGLRCLFQKADLPEVNKVGAGSLVTVKGVCAGRFFDRGVSFVRLDNCQFVTTTGPDPSVVRIGSFDFIRQYEEDLRVFFLPARGLEQRLDRPLTVTQLSKDWKADANSPGKYRHRIVTVSGKLASKAGGSVVLETPETDQPFKVVCWFRGEDFAALADLKEYRITGFCAGMEGLQTLRLDNCTVDASQTRKAIPVLTADYLPHKPGTTLTYDLAAFPFSGKGVVERQVWLQRPGGLTETVVTHTARLAGTTLFAERKGENWTAKKRAAIPRRPGPVYVQKDTAALIEFGPRVPLLRGGTEDRLEPVLKPGVKVGESWDWVRENSKHVYTLERFDTWRGRPSAVVKEVIVTPLAQYRQREIRHVFARGLGEVERQEWVLITSTEKKVVAEKKLIPLEDLPAEPSLEGKGTRAGDGFVGPPPEGKKPKDTPKK